MPSRCFFSSGQTTTAWSVRKIVSSMWHVITFESVVGGGLTWGGGWPVAECRLLEATETLEGEGARMSLTAAILTKSLLKCRTRCHISRRAVSWPNLVLKAGLTSYPQYPISLLRRLPVELLQSLGSREQPPKSCPKFLASMFVSRALFHEMYT